MTRTATALLLTIALLFIASPAPVHAQDASVEQRRGFTDLPSHARVVFVHPGQGELIANASGTAAAPLVYMGQPGQPRPLVTGIRSDGPLHHVWFIGLHVGTSAGGEGIAIRAAKGPISDILIEDCLIEGAKMNIVIEARKQWPAENISVRRCIIRNSHASEGFSQGLFAQGVHNLRIEENIFDHNGWLLPQDRNIFNHAVYLQNANTAPLIRGNILARSSSHGMNLLSGGLIEQNIVWNNALGIHLKEARPAVVRQNVFAASNDIAPDKQRGVGINIDRSGRVLVQHNLLLDRESKRDIQAIKLDGKGVPEQITIQANLVRNWTGIRGETARVEDNLIDPEGFDWSLEKAAKQRGYDSFAHLLAALTRRERGQWDDNLAAPAIVKEGLDAANLLAPKKDVASSDGTKPGTRTQ